MDDAAASQQLMDEHTSPRKTAPPSSPFPFPATQSQTVDTAVEVPDSQATAAAAPAATLSPKSSAVVPSTVIKGKSKRTYEKSKQLRRFNIVREVEPLQDLDNDGDTTIDAVDTASPSRAPARRNRLLARTTARHLIGDGNRNDDVNSSSPPTGKLKRIKKPTRSRPVPARKTYEFPDDEPHTTKRSSTSPAAKESRHKTAHTVLGQDGQGSGPKEADGRSFRQQPVFAAQNAGDDALMQEPVHSDIEVPSNPRSDSEFSIAKEEKETRKRKRRKNKRPSSTTGALLARRANGNPLPIRKSVVQSTDAISAADNALSTVRDLGHPPDRRTNGDFTEDEEELIRRAIKDYQQRRNLDTPDLVCIIQWTRDDLHRGEGRQTSTLTPQEQEDVSENNEFWQEMKSIELNRPFVAVRAHIRARYHQYKTGGWTEEEDKQLRSLYDAHPKRWKFISTCIGDRSLQDCQNRWRDYLQYGDKRNTSTWSKDEEELLIRVVNTIAQRHEDHRAESGQPPLDKYTSKDISWPQVSVQMGGTRSRLQACTKWKKLQQRADAPQIKVEYKPRKEEARSASPVSVKKGKRGRPRKNASMDEDQPKKRRKSKKSQVIAQDSEHDIEDDNTARPGLNGSDQPQSSPDHPLSNNDKKPTAYMDHAEESVQDQEEITAQDEVEESAQEDEEDEYASEKQEVVQDQQESKPQEGANDTAQEHEDDVAQISEEEDIREEVEASAYGDEDENLTERHQENIHAQEADDVKNQEHDAIEDQEEDQPTTATSTPSPTMHRNTKESKAISPTTGASSVDKMCWGDKHDLLMALGERMDWYDEEDIEWDEVAKTMKYPWSTKTLQSALHAMIQLLRDNDTDVDEDDLPGVIDKILGLIGKICTDAELEEHYDPYQDVGPENGVEVEETTPATPPPTEKKKKKKKQKPRDNEQLGSSSDKKRKRK